MFENFTYIYVGYATNLIPRLRGEKYMVPYKNC